MLASTDKSKDALKKLNNYGINLRSYHINK